VCISVSDANVSSCPGSQDATAVRRVEIVVFSAAIWDVIPVGKGSDERGRERAALTMPDRRVVAE
jgi:hypothetical protein